MDDIDTGINKFYDKIKSSLDKKDKAAFKEIVNSINIIEIRLEDTIGSLKNAETLADREVKECQRIESEKDDLFKTINNYKKKEQSLNLKKERLITKEESLKKSKAEMEKIVLETKLNCEKEFIERSIHFIKSIIHGTKIKIEISK